MSAGFRSLMWYLLFGTRGGPNRRRILEVLREGPCNAHKLAQRLELDYRTVRHHLGLLERNGAVHRLVESAYGAPFELTPWLALRIETLDDLARAEERPRGRWASPARRPNLPAKSSGDVL